MDIYRENINQNKSLVAIFISHNLDFPRDKEDRFVMKEPFTKNM